MSYSLDLVKKQTEEAARALLEACQWKRPKLLVIGASTSEVVGEHIGTSGTLDTAEAIYQGLMEAGKDFPFVPVFQCCEHLNRALVIEEEIAEQLGYTIVHAIPAVKAGGSMATYAYQQMLNPVLVEHVAADAGIDIGDTLIGMHLKHVAVPFRASIKSIGNAHLTMAFTRPKLIGGRRAIY